MSQVLVNKTKKNIFNTKPIHTFLKHKCKSIKRQHLKIKSIARLKINPSFRNNREKYNFLECKKEKMSKF